MPNKKRVIVLGGTGMLGHMVVDVLRRSDTIDLAATYTYSSKQYIPESLQGVDWRPMHLPAADDNLELAQTLGIVGIKSYDYIINCIGQIKPRIKNEHMPHDIKEAIGLNVLLPAYLVRIIDYNENAKLISIATDCVYSGTKGDYIESDAPDVSDLYGLSKAMGEIVHDRHLILRTSIIGPELYNKYSLLEWFLKQSPNGAVKGFTNHYWNGITTCAFACIARGLIESGYNFNNDLKDGIKKLHITPSTQLSKHQLLFKFKALFGRNDLVITPHEAGSFCDRRLATINGVVNKKLWELSDWEDMPTLENLLTEMAIYMKTVYLK